MRWPFGLTRASAPARLVSALLATLLPNPVAMAAEREAQMAGLFTQACLTHAGHPPALVAWAEAAHLPALPPAGQRAFLAGRTGMVWDATNPFGGKLVLIGFAGGACAVAAPLADAYALSQSLQDNLARMGVRIRIVEAGRGLVAARFYDAISDERRWTLTLTTAPDDPGAPVLLTAEARS